MKKKSKNEPNQQDIKFYLPEDLVNYIDDLLLNHPPEFPEGYKYDKLIFYYIIQDLLVCPYAHPELKNDKMPEFFPLNSEFLQKKYGNKYAHYIWYLDTFAKIILCGNVHQPGISKIYKINERLLVNPDKMIEIKIPYNSKIWKYIHDYKKKEKKVSEQLPSHLVIMRNHFFKNYRLDEVPLIDYIKKNRLKNISGKIAYIKQINGGVKNKGLYFRRNDTNLRISTNLTDFFKEAAYFIKSDEVLVQLDLTNSAAYHLNLPLRRILLLKSKLYSKLYSGSYTRLYNNNRMVKFSSISPTICTEVVEKAIQRVGITDVQPDKKITRKIIKQCKTFLELTGEGTLYEVCGHILKTDRDTAKDEWMYFAYGQSGVKPYLEYGISSVFRFVVKCMNLYKKDDHVPFSNFLTSIESICVLDYLCKRLVDENIIPYTKHDCVIVPKSKVARTKEIINEVYSEILGVPPAIKETILTPSTLFNEKSKQNNKIKTIEKKCSDDCLDDNFDPMAWMVEQQKPCNSEINNL